MRASLAKTYAKKSHRHCRGARLPFSKPDGKIARLETVVPISKIVRDCVREIGYVNDDDVFHADKIDIQNIITRQSPDIAPRRGRARRRGWQRHIGTRRG